jgi:hypothetical protein
MVFIMLPTLPNVLFAAGAFMNPSWPSEAQLRSSLKGRGTFMGDAMLSTARS